MIEIVTNEARLKQTLPILSQKFGTLLEITSNIITIDSPLQLLE